MPFCGQFKNIRSESDSEKSWNSVFNLLLALHLTSSFSFRLFPFFLSSLIVIKCEMNFKKQVLSYTHQAVFFACVDNE